MIESFCTDQPVGRERGIQHVLYVEFILTVIESARVPTLLGVTWRSKRLSKSTIRIMNSWYIFDEQAAPNRRATSYTCTRDLDTLNQWVGGVGPWWHMIELV